MGGHERPSLRRDRLRPAVRRAQTQAIPGAGAGDPPGSQAAMTGVANAASMRTTLTATTPRCTRSPAGNDWLRMPTANRTIAQAANAPPAMKNGTFEDSAASAAASTKTPWSIGRGSLSHGPAVGGARARRPALVPALGRLDLPVVV